MPKASELFRIRDKTTGKDMTASQYALNLKTLFSNIMAVASVPADAVKGAIQKAVTHAGIEFMSAHDEDDAVASPGSGHGSEPSEAVMVVSEPTVVSSSEAPSVANSQERPSVANSQTACSIDSPANEIPFFIHDYVAVGVTNGEDEKTWRLGVIDELHSTGAKVSFFVPVPGRMGENRVVFFPPIEDEAYDIPTNSFLPITPTVATSSLDSKEVFVVQNHEEIDELFKSASM